MGFVFGGLMTTYERTEPFRGLPGQVDTSNMPMREAVGATLNASLVSCASPRWCRCWCR